MFRNNLPLVLAAWMAVIGLIVIVRRRKHVAGAGLVLAYILNLWLIHWVASAVYILPWYSSGNLATTIAGTEQSLYAIAAFAFGSLVLAPLVVDSGILPRARGVFDFDPRLPRTYLYAGILFFMALGSPLGRIPSAAAVFSSGQQLIIAGIGLCWWQAWKAGNHRTMAFWLAAAGLLPFFTLITRGFMSYGVIAAITVLLFISGFFRSRLMLVLIAAVCAYVGLSVYVTYMRDRGVIRQSVWGQEGYDSRWATISNTVGNFEWFDFTNPAHLARVDDRLNQSNLVGYAVLRLEGTGDFAYGSTLRDAALALIPRALWVNKTIGAGSGNLVSQYTGIQFDTQSTSVGVGSVLEFYINFGTTGILVGFTILGLIVTALDILATERLLNSDLAGFVMYYVPGIAFLQVGGQFVEVTASAAGAVVVIFLVNNSLHRYQRRQAVPPVIFPGGSETAPLADTQSLANVSNPV